MTENEITVETDDGRMRVFLVHPDVGGPFPVAVLYMDGVGYREQVKATARRFAADGYCRVAPDLFYRFGEDVTFDFSQMGDPGFRARVVSLVGGLKPEMVTADTKALLALVGAARTPATCRMSSVSTFLASGASRASTSCTSSAISARTPCRLPGSAPAASRDWTSPGRRYAGTPAGIVGPVRPHVWGRACRKRTGSIGCSRISVFVSWDVRVPCRMREPRSNPLARRAREHASPAAGALRP